MILSLWTVIALFCRLTCAQLPDQGNAFEFPSSFGMTGGLLSGMMGFVDMFDPSLGPPPPPLGFAPTDPPSPPQGSPSAGQVLLSSGSSALNHSKPGQNGLDSTAVHTQGKGQSSLQPSTGVFDPISTLTPDDISTNDAEGIAVTPPFDMSTPDVAMLSPASRRGPPSFDMSPRDAAKPLQPITRGPPPFDMSPRDGAKPLQPITRGPPPFDMSPRDVAKPLQPITRGPPPFDMSPRDGAKPLQSITRGPPPFDMSPPVGAKPLQPIPRGPPPFDMSPRDGAKPLQPITRGPPPFDMSPPNGSKPLQPIQSGNPPFNMSPSVGTTQKPKPRDPVFIDKSSLGRSQSKGPIGADSSQPVHKNVTDKEVQSTGQSSSTGANRGSSFSGSGDLFGGLPAQRHDPLVNASVNITKQQSNNAPVLDGSQQTRPIVRPTTAKATTTAFTTTTKRPVLPTVPVSNQQIFQMLNTFSSQRVIRGKSQGNPIGPQKSNSPPGQARGLNKNQGPAQTGDQNSFPAPSLSIARGGNMSGIQSPPQLAIVSGRSNSGQVRGQGQDQGQSQGRGGQSPSGSSQQVVVDGLGVIDFGSGATNPTGWTDFVFGLPN